MDLKDAFHQVSLDQESRPLTCTSTPLGSKQWRVIVMGLKNGVAIFQRVVDYCLREVNDVAAPYVDDIIIGTESQGTWEDTIRAHDRDICRVLGALQEHKLVADRKKCKFFVKEVEFCGHILGEGRRRPAPGKLMAVENWEEPKTITALRGFLGFTNYYSAYVPGYAELAATLMDILKVSKQDGKKGSKKAVRFTKEQRQAFDQIKSRLLGGLELFMVNPDKPFVLRVDASDKAVGAALEQFDDDLPDRPTEGDTSSRKRHPVAFLSRKLTPGQVRTWTPREKETYAVVLALQKWASWIGLQPILVVTDHKSLEAWATEVLDTPSGPGGRKARWDELLSKFDVTVVYVPGKYNEVADALSRWAYPASQAFADSSIHGSDKDAEDMEGLVAKERQEEKTCRVPTPSRGDTTPTNIGVTTRGGSHTGGEVDHGSAPSPKPKPKASKGKKTDDRAPHSGEGDSLDGASGEPPSPSMGGNTSPSPSSIPRAKGEERASTAPTPCDRDPMTGLDPEEHPPRRRLGSEDPAVDPRDSGEESPVSYWEESSSSSGLGVPRPPPPSKGTAALEPAATGTPIPEINGDWDGAYEACPVWGPILGGITTDEDEWPEGVRYDHGRLYRHGLLCIPTDKVQWIIRQQHGYCGHPGGNRLWPQLQRFYEFPDPKEARKFTDGVAFSCEVCQVSEPTRGPYKSHIEPTPIPPYLMDSVSIDLFAMPEVTHDGVPYDTMALVVDRESGWMVATPHTNKGLTAEKVAKTMYRQWEMFGIPSVVSSDQGQHFASAWWRSLCAAHGVRVAYSQAYHHQANGRVESAGQQVMKKLTKLVVDPSEPKYSWVELLPKALRHLHDTPGECGLSPYEIVFGRHRPMAGLPYRPLREAEDARVFIEKMGEQDSVVAQRLNAIQERRAKGANANRRDHPPLKVGSKVWYRPEPQPGRDKLEPRWKGPGTVLRRVGAHSYVIELEPGGEQEAHRSQLRPHVEDTFSVKPFAIYYFTGKAPTVDLAPDEWLVEGIDRHRPGGDGKPEFLVRWQGWDPTDRKWEPTSSFFPGYNEVLIEYCQKHGITLDLTHALATPETTRKAKGKAKVARGD